MGMFDEITVKYKLPGNYQKTVGGWQTKSMDCLMDHYVIEADGTLWVQPCPYSDSPRNEGRNDELERCHHSGGIMFGTYDSAGKWVECYVTFKDGVVIPESVQVEIDGKILEGKDG